MTSSHIRKLPVIDCDIHPGLDGMEALFPYLGKKWVDHLKDYGVHTRQVFANTMSYPRIAKDTARADAWPENGKPPGADLAFMRKQHIDPANLAWGMLQPLRPGAAAATDRDLSVALCRAINDWQIGDWIDPEPRLRGSIVIPYEHTADAVAEIERCAGRPEFRQVAIPPKAIEPLGRSRFWPIYEAAEAHNLPLGIHVGGVSGHPISGGGWPSYYMEDHNSNIGAIQANVISFIFEGVTTRFPDLRIVMIEGGFGWTIPLAARMDRLAVQFRSELKRLGGPPSDHLRRAFYFTTQPVEEPPERAWLARLMRDVGIGNLMFSSDYPHWDSDEADFAVPRSLSPDERRAVLYGNAASLYGLPVDLPAPVAV